MIIALHDYIHRLFFSMRRVCNMSERSMIYSVFSVIWAVSSKSLWLFSVSSCSRYPSIASSSRQPKIYTLRELKRKTFLLKRKTQMWRTSLRSGKILLNLKRCHAHLWTKKYANIILSDCLSSTISNCSWRTFSNHSAATVVGIRRKNCRSCMNLVRKELAANWTFLKSYRISTRSKLSWKTHSWVLTFNSKCNTPLNFYSTLTMILQNHLLIHNIQLIQMTPTIIIKKALNLRNN